MSRAPLALVALLAAQASVVHAEAAPDAANGKKLFVKCALCHNADSPAAKLGPSLQGIVNRKVAIVAGYAYSPAMKAASLSWTKQNLDKFITAPGKMITGTKMVFAGIGAANERADIIAYLESVSAPARKPR